MSLTRTQIVIIGAVGALIIVIALMALGIIPGFRQDAGQKITLTVWGIEPSGVMNVLFADYAAGHKGVQIKYTQLDSETYEQDLIDALATASAPDIAMFHSAWLPKHFQKFIPANSEQMNAVSVRKFFPRVVEQDFAPDGPVYALPLYIDTLALFYNQDIFDAKGAAFPPATWEDFKNIIPKLRELDKSGNLKKAAAGIGGSTKNISHAADLLVQIMLQSGTRMVSNDFFSAAFASSEGQSALEFYTQFADSLNPEYTWHDALPDALDSFAAGDLAMMFGYAADREALKEKNPFLQYAVAPALQPQNASQAVNVADYWGLAVTNKSRNPQAAWDLIAFLTTDANVAAKYLQLANRPPALRRLIDANLENPDLGVFARQALTARSWPQINNTAVTVSFSRMIESVIAGQKTAEQAIQQAEDEITRLMQKRK